MPELLVDIDEARGMATVNGPNLDEESWIPIREALEFGATEVRFIGHRKAELPVYCLLRARSDLRHALRRVARFGVEPNFSATAKRLLVQATERERLLAQPNEEIREEEVSEKLKAAGFVRELKPYQARNVAKLVHLPSGATFSVPGAGKTSEALALFALKRSSHSRLLVICPKNAFAVWEEQLRLCLPNLAQSVCRLRGTNADISASIESACSVLLINYDLVPRHLKALMRLCVKSQTWIIVDESHRIKAWPLKVTGSAVLSLAPFAEGRLIMSGTPMPNAERDLIPQYTFLYPEAKADADEIVRLASRVFVRTTKPELNIPAVDRIQVAVPMSEPQSILYKALTADLVRQLPGLVASERIMLRRIGRSVLRLIQTASDPALLAKSDIRHHALLQRATLEPSPKIQRACDIARRLAQQGQKCLIWSNFVGNVLQIATLLSDLGAEFVYGEVKTSEDDEILDSRESKIRRFKEDPNCFVLVANPAACAESISLHLVCHHAIYVDRIYNAAQYLQSEDRIHRLGLREDQKTSIYLLVSPTTVDESVERRLKAKVLRMSQFLNDPGLSIPAIDISDDVSIGFDAEDLNDLRNLLGVTT